MTDTLPGALDSAVSAALLATGTASVSDALDRLGLTGSAVGIMPLAPGQRMAGPAFTVRYVPTGASGGNVGDFIDHCVPGQVVVLDNGGRQDCTVWGDILTTIADRRGLAGTVIDGVCRDVSCAVGLGYAIYSRGRFMRTGKDRVTVAEIGGTVAISDAAVSAGDIVVGDDDGIVVVPRSRADEVAAVAATIHDAEARILDGALAGARLADVRARHGYHELQRKPATP
jgi:regulator of RNase E activity RraA